MEEGQLYSYFVGAAVKRLADGEINPRISNQHEFNGSKNLKKLFGIEELRQKKVKFLYLSDGNDFEPVLDDGFITWYDARARSAERTGKTEWRMYYQGNDAISCAEIGDLLIIAKQEDGEIVIFIAGKNTNVERRLLWLFNGSGVSLESGDFDFIDTDTVSLMEQLLELSGIDKKITTEDYLDIMLKEFDGKFPDTTTMSKFARETFSKKTFDNVDSSLVAYVEREEGLFRTLERFFLRPRLEAGFDPNFPDDFIQLALSVINRRKSRVGMALENHLEHIFNENFVLFDRGKVTEHKKKPDFIFPSIGSYKDITFSKEKLSMLAAKYSCKDRWRQVINEANRIDIKHLVTFERSISIDQTSEMQAHNLQLVVPKILHESYDVEQRNWLMSLEQFIDHVKGHQTQDHL